MFFNNNIKKCKLLGKLNIDIEKEQSNNPESVRKIMETDKYIFYAYINKKYSYNHYIIRQEKGNKKHVVSFDWINERYLDFVSTFDGNLILASAGHPELNMWDNFLFIDINTGKRQNVRLRSDFGNLSVIGGYGRFYNQDKINKMYNQDGKLIIEFTRIKSNRKEAEGEKYNYDMNYVLTLAMENGKVLAHRSYEDNN